MTGKPWAANVTPVQLVEELFDPMRVLRPLTNQASGITHHFTLAHIVSGAMVVGLVERAKGIAARRDMAARVFSGLTVADLRMAVDALFEESKNLDHQYALREFIETVAIPFEEARKMGVLN